MARVRCRMYPKRHTHSPSLRPRIHVGGVLREDMMEVMPGARVKPPASLWCGAAPPIDALTPVFGAADGVRLYGKFRLSHGKLLVMDPVGSSPFGIK